mgnify:CR=1 FL=1
MGLIPLESLLCHGRSVVVVFVTDQSFRSAVPVSYTHLRAHETVLDLVCRLLLEKKKEDTTDMNVTNYTNNNVVS